MDSVDTMRIRVGTPDDLDEIMKLAMSACEENGFLNPDAGRLASEIWPALHQDHGIVGIIGQPGGKIEGGIRTRSSSKRRRFSSTPNFAAPRAAGRRSCVNSARRSPMALESH